MKLNWVVYILFANSENPSCGWQAREENLSIEGVVAVTWVVTTLQVGH